MKLLIDSQTSTVQPLKFGNWWVMSSHTLPGMWLLIHAVIKVKPCQWNSSVVSTIAHILLTVRFSCNASHNYWHKINVHCSWINKYLDQESFVSIKEFSVKQSQFSDKLEVRSNNERILITKTSHLCRLYRWRHSALGLVLLTKFLWKSFLMINLS